MGGPAAHPDGADGHDLVAAAAPGHMAACAKAAGVPVRLNPAPAAPMPTALLSCATWLSPNEHEAALLFPRIGLEDLLAQQQGKLIITLGAQGAAAWSEGKVIRIPSRKANVVDTTGAGDTFNGAFAYALADGESLEAALRFANVAASLSTEGFGAQGGMPTLNQVKKELQ